MRVSHAEYVWKIRTNSDRARNLGAEVRFHKTPIAAWFTVIDGELLVRKPVDVFGSPSLTVSNDLHDVRYFATAFHSLWAKALAQRQRSATESRKIDREESSSVSPLKVFLCHASDDKPLVRELYGRLAEGGIEPWLDEVDILPGQDWDLEIKQAVRRADAVVVLLSRASTTKRGYLQKEIKIAFDTAAEQPEGSIFLIPARLEDCAVPESLQKWQYVDLFRENGFDRLLRSLLKTNSGKKK
jgi:hypothetical protein